MVPCRCGIFFSAPPKFFPGFATGVEDPEGQLQERHEIAGEIIDFSFDFLFVCVEKFFAWVVQFAF